MQRFKRVFGGVRARWLVALAAAVVVLALFGIHRVEPRWGVGEARALLSTGRSGSPVETLLLLTRTDPNGQEAMSGENFEAFKRNQQVWVKSRLVVQAALRNVEVSRLPIVKREKDPTAWLTKSLQVEFVGNSDLMSIGMDGDDREQLATLINAVRNSYMDEVVNGELQDRMRQKQMLERRMHDYQSQIASMAASLQNSEESKESVTQRITSHRLQTNLDRLDRTQQAIDEIDSSLIKLTAAGEEKAAAKEKSSLATQREALDERRAKIQQQVDADNAELWEVERQRAKLDLQRAEVEQLRAYTARLADELRTEDLRLDGKKPVIPIMDASP